MAVLILGPGSPNTSFNNLQGPSLVNGSAARLNGVHCVNDGDYPIYLQLFNAVKVSDVVLGTTIPRDIIAVPAADWSGLNVEPGKAEQNYGLNAPNYGLGIVIAATQSRDGNDKALLGDVFANVKSTEVG